MRSSSPSPPWKIPHRGRCDHRERGPRGAVRPPAGDGRPSGGLQSSWRRVSRSMGTRPYPPASIRPRTPPLGAPGRLHIDVPLLLGLLVLCAFGLVVLYSASNQDLGSVKRQLVRLGLALGLMLALAQVHPAPPQELDSARLRAGPLGRGGGALGGRCGKGAQRWLDLGFMRFQPSEILKLAVPMMVAWAARRPAPAAEPAAGLGAAALTLVGAPDRQAARPRDRHPGRRRRGRGALHRGPVLTPHPGHRSWPPCSRASDMAPRS